MRAYVVTTRIEGDEDFVDLRAVAGSQSAAADIKRNWIEQKGAKRSAIKIEQVEIPYGKEGVIDFINNQLDAVCG